MRSQDCTGTIQRFLPVCETREGLGWIHVNVCVEIVLGPRLMEDDRGSCVVSVVGGGTM